MSAQNRTLSDVGTGILGFVGMSALAGLLVTAAVTPAIAVTGMTASNGITMFENIPGYLEIKPFAQKSNIYAVHNGEPQLMASFYEDNRENVQWENVSQFVKDAAIAGEDPRFYDHGGVDVQGTIRGALETYISGNTQGGSSITQQYVKNVLINNGVREAKTEEERDAALAAATETDGNAGITRKLKEMRYAIALEKKYPKDEILLGYLNIASFGGRVYGIEAAAKYYFGVNTNADLTVAQAASLIAIVNHPEKFRLDEPDSETNGANTVNANGELTPYALTKDRRDYILRQMLNEGKITQEQYDEAVATPIEPKITESSTGCQTAGQGADGFFCDYVVNIIRNQMDNAETQDVNEGQQMLEQGGLDIYTTLDLDLQFAAVQSLNNNVPQYVDGMDLGGSIVSIEVGTGRVLAMAQNKKYSPDPDVLAADATYSAVNFNTDRDYGGSSGFQPGSTFKIFTLTEWLKEGHALNEGVDARRKSNWGTFNNSCDGPMPAGDWNPRNDEGGNGGYWTALFNTINSENTGFVAMAKQLDLCGIQQTAESMMGAKRADGLELGDRVNEVGEIIDTGFKPAAVLGTEEVAPLSMATAFATIAGGGLRCTPIAIDRIVDSEGGEITPPQSKCEQVLDAQVAAADAYALQRVMSEGTGTSSAGRIDNWVPMIGKTGTTDEAYATWMSGASSRVATVAGVYNASGFVNLRDTYFGDTQAAVIRHQLWPDVMNVANAKYGGDGFPDPQGSYLNAPQAVVPDVLGLAPEAAQQALEAAGFGWSMDGEVDSSQPKGTIGAQNPSGSAGRGAVISLQISRGNLTGVPDVMGQSASDAENALKAAGFRVQRKEQDVTDPAQDGIVIAQDPSAGSPAKPGDRVTITVGKLNITGGGVAPGDG
ncbi:transglycosylase domain-containing protein [Agromyces bauzanensis]